MKKETSAAAIAVAVICSIVLFPLIFLGGISSGLVFTLESVVAPNREEEIYQSFVDNGGMDFIYDLLASEAEIDAGEIEVEFEDFFPKNQMETMIYDIYHAIIEGETYQADLSYQKEALKKLAIEEFDATIEEEVIKELQEEQGEEYNLLTESKRQEAIATAIEEAREIFETEMLVMMEEEFDILEEEISAAINSIYDTPEYLELKALEAETGYSITDRSELCAGIRMAGYGLLGITAILIVLLLLSHLFRPSGFFTAGAFSLVTGGFLYILVKGLHGILLSLTSSGLSTENPAEEVPHFIMPMIEEVLGWLPTGFERVGKISLMTAVILILVGILLLVIRKNKAMTENQTSMFEVQ